MYINTARLAACEVGILLREILLLSKIHPTPLFGAILKFIAHGHILKSSKTLATMDGMQLVACLFFVYYNYCLLLLLL